MTKALRFRITRIIASAMMLIIPFAVPAVAHAATVDTTGYACTGANLSLANQANTGNCQNATNGFDTLLKSIINVISVIVGAVAVVMIIVGGLRYITSGGESSSVSGAKNTILFAIIGLIIVVFAQLIVQFVLDRVINSSITTGG